MRTRHRHLQRGAMLIEAIIGLLIFLVGILAMLALQTTAIAVQSDAQYRIEAANLAQRVLGEINLAVVRTDATALANSLAAFAHQPAGNADTCAFSGAASTNGIVTSWVSDITTSTSRSFLPGSTTAMQQIFVNTGNFNEVRITICWKTPNDRIARRYTLVSYVN